MAEAGDKIAGKNSGQRAGTTDRTHDGSRARQTAENEDTTGILFKAKALAKMGNCIAGESFRQGSVAANGASRQGHTLEAT